MNIYSILFCTHKYIIAHVTYNIVFLSHFFHWIEWFSISDKKALEFFVKKMIWVFKTYWDNRNPIVQWSNRNRHEPKKWREWANHCVGRYSIALQGSSTAGVTRPFARTAWLGLCSPKFALSLSYCGERKTVKIRKRSSWNAPFVITHTLRHTFCRSSEIFQEYHDD